MLWDIDFEDQWLYRKIYLRFIDSSPAFLTCEMYGRVSFVLEYLKWLSKTDHLTDGSQRIHEALTDLDVNLITIAFCFT